MSAAVERLRRGYDRLAPIYEPLAAGLSFGAIPRSRRRLLRRAAAGARRALVAGGGPGATLIALFDAGFAGEVVHVDLSPAMQRRARSRLRRRRPDALGRVRWFVGSFDALPSTERFDLVCTHFVLDQFGARELARVVARVGATTRPGARWHDVDFATPRGTRALRPARQALLAALYGGFGLVCGLRTRALPPIDRTIRAAGFELLECAPGAGGLLRSALYRTASPAG